MTVPANNSEKTERTVEVGTFYRSYAIDRAAISDDSRSVELSFSSEQPVEQYSWSIGRYVEILDHDPASVDLSRLNDGAALLMDHNGRDQVGVIEKSSIADKKGRATVRFSKSKRGEEIFQDVKDGIRKLISVGYRVTKWVTESIDNEVETMRAMRWQPMEISIVSIPADVTVGIGRNQRNEPTGNTNNAVIHSMRLSHRNLDPAPATGGGGTPATPPAPAATPPPAAPAIVGRATVEDQKAMFSVAKRHNAWALYERAVNENWDSAQFHREFANSTASTPIPGTNVPAPDAGANNRNLSIGERLVKSESYRAHGSRRGSKRTILLEMPDELQFRASNPLSNATESLTSIQKLQGIQILDQQPLRVADLFAQGQTDALTIRYIQEDTYTQAATAVAEGAAKPGASLDLSEVDATVRKIAVYTKITDEMASDFPQVQSYVNARLAYMVGSLEDNHLLNGTNANNQIKGILNFTGLQTVSGALSPADGIFKAISYVRGANGSGFLEADFCVIHPLDYMNIKLTKDGNGQYLGGGPFFGQYGIGSYSNVGTIWGLPAIITTSIAQGTALVGAFRQAAQIFRRMGLTVEMTNTDQDDFIKNLMTVRAEERLALACYKPAGFCTVTGMPA